jgi:pimeloyl-ACP methyl ester carboxylesterase
VEHLDFDDIELTYQLHDAGDRERVVLLHASPFVSWYRPLLEHLTELSTLTYRRRLRRSDGGPYRPLTVAEDTTISVRLMDHVGWARVHVVGHSYGALVALQLALDRPERVGSVALLEPAARGISSSAAVATALRPVIAAYRSGDTAGAIDGFLRHVCGEDYRSALEQVVPDAFDEALAEADQFFQAEMPAVQQWSFGPRDAEHVRQPTLNVLGANTAPRFVEGAALVQSWLPHAERLTIPDAGHLLMIQNPTAVARGLKDHIARHPINSPGPVTA